MTHRPSRTLSLAAIVLFVAALTATTIARAVPSESLSWARTYVGPDDILNPNPPPMDPPPDYWDPYFRNLGALNAVSFVADSSNGWAVGVRINDFAGTPVRVSMFARTTNGGSTWTSGTVPGVSAELLGVTAIAPDDVWAVGDYGTIVHWNGSWSTRSVSGWTGGKRFNAVSFFDSQHGWAVGNGRGVAYTGDGGDTWTTIAPPGATGALYGVAARSATSAVAVGDSGVIKVFGTTGVKSQATVTGTLYSVTFADAEHAWAVGSGAAIFKSSDGGTTWSAVPRPLPVNPTGRSLTASELTMRSVGFFNPYDGVIVGTYQTVWRTSNGGAAWVVDRIVDSTTEDDYELRGVAFAGTASTPVAVGRPYAGQLNSNLHKARVYQGSWTNIPDPATVETTPPVTTSDVQVPAYYANSATISLSATDEGSGVAHTYYILDGRPQVESTTVVVTSAGTHSLEFWSVDVTGNVEAHKTVTFTVVVPPSANGTPSTPSISSTTVKHAKSYTYTGYVIRHTAGTSPITLRFYRYRSGKYVYYKSVTAKVSNVLTFSRYSDSTSVPYAGKWRVRAVHKVGSVYRYSGYRTFTAS